MRDMIRNLNMATRIIGIVFIVLVVALIIEHLYISSINGQIESANEQLSSLQAQTATAKQQSDDITKEYSDKLIEWRNAQGRLSFYGDGSGKVAYLTFDDGPSRSLTKKNLKILKEKGAVGTWFCLANTKTYTYLDLSLCKEIEAQGSAVGIHDWDQNDSYDYYKGTVDNYFKTDFDKTKEALEAAVGHEIKIMRFAGGSPTIKYYNEKIATDLPQAMLQKGYQYFDWNALAGDSDPSLFENGSTPTSTIVSNILSDARRLAKTNSPICVLMHDNPGKETTTKALPEVIDGLKELGYEFKTLEYDSPGFYQAKIIK